MLLNFTLVSSKDMLQLIFSGTFRGYFLENNTRQDNPKETLTITPKFIEDISTHFLQKIA